MDGLKEILEASEGLLYPSESDEPLVGVRWKEIPAEVLAGREVSVEEFFAELEASEEGARWKRLQRVMEEKLAGMRVFRVGERRIGVYVVGKTSGGDWAGIKTVSVET